MTNQTNPPPTVWLVAGFDGFSFLDEGDEPSHDALPTFGVIRCCNGIGREAFVSNPEERAGARALRAGGMQGVHAFRLEFKADDGFVGAAPTVKPGMHQEVRRIDLEVLAADAEFLAIGAYATARPFSSDAKIGFPLGYAVHILSAPPARHLGWIGEGLEDTGGRGRSRR